MRQILLRDTVWRQFVRCCGYIFVVKAYTVVRKVYTVSQGYIEVEGVNSPWCSGESADLVIQRSVVLSKRRQLGKVVNQDESSWIFTKAEACNG